MSVVSLTKFEVIIREKILIELREMLNTGAD